MSGFSRDKIRSVVSENPKSSPISIQFPFVSPFLILICLLGDIVVVRLASDRTILYRLQETSFPTHLLRNISDISKVNLFRSNRTRLSTLSYRVGRVIQCHEEQFVPRI